MSSGLISGSLSYSLTVKATAFLPPSGMECILGKLSCNCSTPGQGRACKTGGGADPGWEPDGLVPHDGTHL